MISRYTLFWILVLVSKFLFSYFLQVNLILKTFFRCFLSCRSSHDLCWNGMCTGGSLITFSVCAAETSYNADERNLIYHRYSVQVAPDLQGRYEHSLLDIQKWLKYKLCVLCGLSRVYILCQCLTEHSTVPSWELVVFVWYVVWTVPHKTNL